MYWRPPEQSLRKLPSPSPPPPPHCPRFPRCVKTLPFTWTRSYNRLDLEADIFIPGRSFSGQEMFSALLPLLKDAKFQNWISCVKEQIMNVKSARYLLFKRRAKSQDSFYLWQPRCPTLQALIEALLVLRQLLPVSSLSFCRLLQWYSRIAPIPAPHLSISNACIYYHISSFNM